MFGLPGQIIFVIKIPQWKIEIRPLSSQDGAPDGRKPANGNKKPDILRYCVRVHKTGFSERMELLLFSSMLKCKFLDAPVGARRTMPLLTVPHDDKRTYIYPEAFRTMAGWGLAAVSVARLSFCLCGSVKLW